VEDHGGLAEGYWAAGMSDGAVPIAPTCNRPTAAGRPPSTLCCTTSPTAHRWSSAVQRLQTARRESFPMSMVGSREILNDTHSSSSPTGRAGSLLLSRVHPSLPWRYFPRFPCHLHRHNDSGGAAYNACFDGDRLARVFDWDPRRADHPLQELLSNRRELGCDVGGLEPPEVRAAACA